MKTSWGELYAPLVAPQVLRDLAAMKDDHALGRGDRLPEPT